MSIKSAVTVASNQIKFVALPALAYPLNPNNWAAIKMNVKPGNRASALRSGRTIRRSARSCLVKPRGRKNLRGQKGQRRSSH